MTPQDRASAGRKLLAEWKAAHAKGVTKLGGHIYCIGCNSPPWPCPTARLIAAVETALFYAKSSAGDDDNYPTQRILALTEGEAND